MNDCLQVNKQLPGIVGQQSINAVKTWNSLRENELMQGVESTRVYTQMDISGGTSVQWFASNDGGETWEAMTIDDTRPIDEDWTEYTLVRTFNDPQGSKVRYKADMTGTVLTYPRIHTLGATLS